MKEEKRRRIRSVEIVEHDHDGRRERERAQTLCGAIEDAETHFASLGSGGVDGSEGIGLAERAKDLRPRPERRRSTGFPCSTPDDSRTGLARERGDRIGEARLSDSGLSREQEERPAAFEDAIDGLTRPTELGAPAPEELPRHDASVAATTSY
jgi:hypothetical protein